MRKYVQDRKKGITKSKMEGADLMSVFLESQDMFSEEDIVSNLLAFNFAAVETSHFVT